MGLIVTTPPTAEPVSLEEAQLFVRAEESIEDGFLQQCIRAAREFVEVQTLRTLKATTYTLTLDCFPCDESPIKLPRPPLQSVTHIKYYDTAGTQQTLSTSLYAVDTAQEPGRVYPAYGETWPTTRDIQSAVEIRYVAGYSSDALIPDGLRGVILNLVESYYRLRGYASETKPQISPFVVQSLWTYKVPEAA